MGTFIMYPAWTHWAHCDQIDGHFVKELNMCPLADGWVHCLKNHNVITMYPLGKWPLAPSVLANMGSPAQLHHWSSSTLSSISTLSSTPTFSMPSSSSQVLSPSLLGPWHHESFPITSNTGNPIMPASDAVAPFVNQPSFLFQFNIQNPQVAVDTPKHFQPAPVNPPVVLSFLRKHKDNTGKFQIPGLKDLPPNIQPNFHNVFIRHIMKLVFSGTSPWSNPSVSVYQQEFNTIYPDHPFCLHGNDAVVLPVCISCYQSHHYFDIFLFTDQLRSECAPEPDWF